MNQTAAKYIDQIENFEKEICLLEKKQLAVLLQLLVNTSDDLSKKFSGVDSLAKKINAELNQFQKKMIVGGICEKIKSL